MSGVGRALRTLARRFPDVQIVLPAHRNPIVRDAVLPHVDGLHNVTVTNPLPYGEFVKLLSMASIVLTDSGGIQEEAATLGKPVLLMRDTTERPEALASGVVRLIGTDGDRVVTEVSTLLTDPSVYEAMAHASTPYGDGQGARRSVEAIRHMLGLGPRPHDWESGRQTGTIPDDLS